MVTNRTTNELLRRNLAQWKESQTPLNRWYAGVALGHDPTPQEAFLHFANNGGAADWRERHDAAV